MEFTKYVIRRLLQMIPVILAVTILNFLIINMAPGDPVTVLAGENATEEYRQQLRIEYGLDKPVTTRLFIYLEKLLQGDMGESYTYKKDVTSVVREKMKVTLMLVIISELAAILEGTLLGTFAARREGKLADKVITTGTIILYCMPAFWLGMMLMLFFALKLKWLPTSGMYSFNAKNIPKWLDLLRHLVLPTLTLFLVHLPVYTKLARSSVLEVASEDYIHTARAIGYSEKKIYRKHALRNALLPTVTMAGMSLSTAFSGALLTETVFSWPGMGRMIYDAVSTRDYPLIMGGFLVTTVMVVVGGFITDIIYMYLDPRVVHS